MTELDAFFSEDLINFFMLALILVIAAFLLNHFEIKGIAPVLVLGGVLIILAYSLHLITSFISSLGYLFFGLGATMAIYQKKNERMGMMQ